jgi:hypothetical protein
MAVHLRLTGTDSTILAADADRTAERLLAEAASRAERQVALVRATLGGLMLLFIGLVCR